MLYKITFDQKAWPYFDLEPPALDKQREKTAQETGLEKQPLGSKGIDRMPKTNGTVESFNNISVLSTTEIFRTSSVFPSLVKDGLSYFNVVLSYINTNVSVKLNT